MERTKEKTVVFIQLPYGIVLDTPEGKKEVRRIRKEVGDDVTVVFLPSGSIVEPVTVVDRQSNYNDVNLGYPPETE